MTQQSFEATPVVLPTAAREDLVLEETVRDSRTIIRERPSGTVEVEITNH